MTEQAKRYQLMPWTNYLRFCYSIFWILLIAFVSGCSGESPAPIPTSDDRLNTATPATPPTPVPSPTPTSVPSLRSLADELDMWIGTATDPGYLADENYAALVAQEFNMLTPEVVMKFEVTQPAPGQYDFTQGDAVVTFAEAHGMQVRGHVLVWGNQLPEWIKQAYAQGLYSREQWMEILRNHIQAVVGHYRGRIYAWDVVNEAVADDGSLYGTIWLDTIGSEYIALAFRWAREADPQALLFYNDNGGEGLNRKSDGIYALAKGLVDMGVPIDGVGMQMHVWLGGAPSMGNLASNMQRLGDLGLTVNITEMDVRLQYSDAPMDERLAAQAELYRDVFATCLQAPNCDTFITWGATDSHSWIPGYTGNPDAPLLFDRDGKPKVAYFAIMEELSRTIQRKSGQPGGQ